MAQAQLYIHDPVAELWIPLTAAILGGGADPNAATAANQALAIASLQALDLDNATEAQQINISNAIASLEAAWLAENATEARQQELIAKNEAIRIAIAEISGKVTNSIAQSTSTNNRLGFDANNTLETAIANLNTLLTDLKNNTSSTALTWGASTAGAIGTSAANLLPADANRKAVRICNNFTAANERIYINFDTDASLTSFAYAIQREQTLELDLSIAPIDKRISAIGSKAGLNLTYLEAT